MGTETQNPLFKHFRQPQLHLKLPSNGRWWGDGALDLPVTGEIPVYPMTAKDELTIKTPDALLNGSATVDVIQSCCPNIKNAWNMPTVDLDAILIAIRIATYGPRMEFASVCPNCGNKNEHAADLSILAGTIVCPDFDTTVNIDGLEIYLQPENYRNYTTNSMRNFEEQRMLNMLSNEDIPETEKLARFNEMFNKLVSTTINHIVRSVAGINTEDNILVDDYDQLVEFFNNCNRPVWDAVKERILEMGNQNTLRHIPVKCEETGCQHEYEAPLLFELSSFFG